MERIANLVIASAQLRRQIWASLPISVRIGEFLVRLASSGTDAFGKTVYAEFIKHGIEGLPDVHGEPASSLAGERDLIRRLPPGYGREFGTKCYRILISKYHNPQMVEDLMSTFMVKFLGGASDNLKEGSTLRTAEQYVLTSLVHEGINFIRKKREISDTYESGDDDEEVRFENSVPAPDESAEQVLNRILPKVRSKLKAIHPDAELYVKLSILEGYSDVEIVGDVAEGKPSMLTHPYNASGGPLDNHSWTVLYKKKIYAALKQALGPEGISALV